MVWSSLFFLENEASLSHPFSSCFARPNCPLMPTHLFSPFSGFASRSPPGWVNAFPLQNDLLLSKDCFGLAILLEGTIFFKASFTKSTRFFQAVCFINWNMHLASKVGFCGVLRQHLGSWEILDFCCRGFTSRAVSLC